MRALQPTTCKAIAALVATAAIAALAAPTASADVTTVGLGGWQVQSTAQATQSPAAISTPGFGTASWLHVRPDDAGAPGTEVGALVQTGHCPNVFFSTNMKQCFGYLTGIGDPVPQFAVPWWFRTDFTAHPGSRRQHRSDRQRRRRRGRRLGQRARGRDPRHSPGRRTRATRSTSAACCAMAPTRSRSRSIRTTRTRCSRSTTSTGRRSRPTTTPASSSRSSCTPRASSRSEHTHVVQDDAADLSTAALTLKARRHQPREHARDG